MPKVLYFTAGPVPTTEEKAEIDALNASIITVGVRNGAVNASYGSKLEPVDFVAGIIPTAYAAIPEYVPGGGGGGGGGAAVFGDKTTKGANTTFAAGFFGLTRVLLAPGSSLVSVGFAVAGALPAGSTEARVGVYAELGSVPGVKLGQSNVFNAATWALGDIITPLTAPIAGTGQYVWLGVCFTAAVSVPGRPGDDRYFTLSGTTLPDPSPGTLALGSAWAMWGEGTS